MSAPGRAVSSRLPFGCVGGTLSRRSLASPVPTASGSGALAAAALAASCASSRGSQAAGIPPQAWLATCWCSQARWFTTTSFAPPMCTPRSAAAAAAQSAPTCVSPVVHGLTYLGALPAAHRIRLHRWLDPRPAPRRRGRGRAHVPAGAAGVRDCLLWRADSAAAPGADAHAGSAWHPQLPLFLIAPSPLHLPSRTPARRAMRHPAW